MPLLIGYPINKLAFSPEKIILEDKTMKSKKSLLSVLFAAVLLCACVAGMLIFGAGAEEVPAPVVYYVDSESEGTAETPAGDNNTFKDINQAMIYADTVANWPAGSTLIIEFKQQEVTYDTSNHNTLFYGDANTGRIETEEHEGLPITVRYGDGSETLSLSMTKGEATELGHTYIVNDFIFNNVKFLRPSYGYYYMRVASQRVEFNSCTFPHDVPDADHKTSNTSYIIANGYTFGGYYLTEDNLSGRMVDGKIQTEVVFSGSTAVTYSSKKVSSTTYYYGVRVFAQKDIAGGEYFPTSNTVGDTTLTYDDFAGKITVKDSASIARIDGTCSPQLSDATVHVKSGTVTSLFGISGNISTAAGHQIKIQIDGGVVDDLNGTNGQQTMQSGTLIDMVINSGWVKQIYGIYSGSGSPSVLNSGAVVNLTINGVTEGKTHGSSGAVKLVCSKWPAMAVKQGAAINFTLNGGKTSSVYACWGASESSSNNISGTINMDLLGGTSGSVYALYEAYSATAKDPQAKIRATGVVNITVDGATTGSTYLVYSDGGKLVNGEPAETLGDAVVEGVINYEYKSGTIGSTLVGATSGENATNSTTFVEGTINIKMNAPDTTYSGNLIGVAGKAVVQEQGKVNISIEKGTVDTVYGVSGDATVNEGLVNVDIKSNITKAYGVSGNATLNDKAEVRLTLCGGTIGTFMYCVNKTSTATINSGAVVSAYLNSGSYEVNNAKLLESYDLGSSKTAPDRFGTYTQFQSGSTFHVEFNGASVPKAVTLLHYVTLNANLEVVITKLDHSETGAYFRPISYSAINGDVTVTIDTTKDGWTGAEGDDNTNLEGKQVTMKTFHPGWGGYVSGTGTMNINGGNDKSTVDIEICYGVSASTIVNNINNAEIGTFEVARGGRVENSAYGISSISNTVKGCNITTRFVGAGQNYGALYVNGPVENTIENSTINSFYPAGRNKADVYTNCQVTNTIRGAETKITNFYPSYVGSGSGSITFNTTIEGGTYPNSFKAGVATIKGGTFEGAVTGTVALADNANITLAGEGTIVASSVGTDVTVTKSGELGSFETVYVKAPAGSSVTFVSDKEAKIITSDTYEVRGWYLPLSAVLKPEEKVFIKITVAKDLYDLYNANFGDPGIAFTFGGNAVVPKTDLTPDGNVYYMILPAAGAGSFETNLVYKFGGDEVLTTNISKIAADGANLYKDDAKIANVFKALVDYGASVNGGTLQYVDAAALEAYGQENFPENDDRFSFSRDDEKYTIEFTGITLLMGDTVGIRLKADPFTGAKVYYGTMDEEGLLTAGEDYRVNETAGTIDLYINAASYETTLHIYVTDGAGNLCLELNESVAHLVYTMLEANQDNVRLQAVAMLILRMNEFAA